MSLVEDLGQRLREVGGELPLAELLHARQRLCAASALFALVMTESEHAGWLAELDAAGAHLDDAIARTTGVLGGLDDYLGGIGLTGVDTHATRDAAIATKPARATAGERPDPVLAARTWWVERVELITGHEPDDEDTPEVTPARDHHDADGAQAADGTPEDPTDTLVRLAKAARGGAGGYRAALLATHPGSGLQVPARADRALRRLATDLLGHAPGPDDRRALTGRTARHTGELLPKLPDALPAELVARVCDPHGGTAAHGPHHPVDVAAAWPALVADALSATGTDVAELPRLIQPPEFAGAAADTATAASAATRENLTRKAADRDGR